MPVLGETRIPQFLPSLEHMATVKLVNHIFGDLLDDVRTLKRAYAEIQLSTSQVSLDLKAKRAKAKLMLIPVRLRQKVYQTILGMHHNKCTWLIDHFSISTITSLQGINLFFRCNGTLNRAKTAEYFVSNQNVNIKLRFHIACLYCLEETVISLWKEMEACGETKNFYPGDQLMINFWMKWIQEGCPIPWFQALKEYIADPPILNNSSVEDRLLISPFFNHLQPDEREVFLPYLKHTDNCDDFLRCLHAATKEEKVIILDNNSARLLKKHLTWPLENIFLDIAEMAWPFLGLTAFQAVLSQLICQFRKGRKDFDYYQLLQDFWNSSPTPLKETFTKADPTMSKEVTIQIQVKISGLGEMEDWKEKHKNRSSFDIHKTSTN